MSLQPLPARRILPPEEDRVLMEWDPGTAETPVLSWHPEVLQDLCSTPDEVATLLALTLAEAGMLRPEAPPPGNFVLGLMLVPVSYLSAQEIHENADRLAARGFLRRTGPGDIRSVDIDPNVIRIIGRRQLDPRLLMQWNAAKASWPGPPVPCLGD
ncbi:hypothetical protein PV318_00110 [Streptomyces sp. ME02-6991-2B]|nr:hypothetical protein [Streptomyces sp. ME02-6991-2B]